MRKTLMVIVLAAAFGACSEKERLAVVDPLPSREPESKVGAAPQPSGRITGRVLETMNAAGYTYMRLDTPNGEVWTAVRETRVEKGATVAIDTQMVAENFESATLKRKFDRLVMGAIADASSPVVVKASGGPTIAETWAKRKDLAGKEVVIRGTVVKFLPQIMGKNWLHVRDGSGSREEGTDDITVTTTDVAKVGDVVTVTGTASVDRDFGSGYSYPVIIEDADVQRDKP